ncbi:MAG: DEAD/DEAH box helicase family protein, partial [Pseudomonadota bacterium]
IDALCDSYEDADELIEDLRKEDLVRALDVCEWEIDKRPTGFTYLKASPVDHLRQLARMVYVDCWEPSEVDERPLGRKCKVRVGCLCTEECEDSDEDEDEDEEEEEGTARSFANRSWVRREETTSAEREKLAAAGPAIDVVRYAGLASSCGPAETPTSAISEPAGGRKQGMTDTEREDLLAKCRQESVEAAERRERELRATCVSAPDPSSSSPVPVSTFATRSSGAAVSNAGVCQEVVEAPEERDALANGHLEPARCCRETLQEIERPAPSHCVHPIRVLEEPREHLDLLCSLVEEAEDVRVVSGYVSEGGLRLIAGHCPRFQELVSKGAVVILGGDGSNQLTKEAIAWFDRLGASEQIRVVPTGREAGMGRIHAKAWLIRSRTGFLWATVGSANLTLGGLTSNRELGLFVPVPDSSSVARELFDWFESLNSTSRPANADDFDHEQASLEAGQTDSVALTQTVTAASTHSDEEQSLVQVKIVPYVPPTARPAPSIEEEQLLARYGAAASLSPERVVPTVQTQESATVPAERSEWSPGAVIQVSIDDRRSALLDAMISCLTIDGRRALLRDRGCEADGTQEVLNRRLKKNIRAGVIDTLDLVQRLDAWQLRRLADEHGIECTGSDTNDLRNTLAARFSASPAVPAERREWSPRVAISVSTDEQRSALFDDVLFNLTNEKRRAVLRSVGCEVNGTMDVLNERLKKTIRAGLINTIDVMRQLDAWQLRWLADEHGIQHTGSNANALRNMMAAHLESAAGRRVTSRSMPAARPPVEPASARLQGVRTICGTDEPSELVDHQREALKVIERKVAEPGEGLIISLPTGGGKTRVAVSWILGNVIGKGRRALWVAHCEELLDQVVEAVESCAFEARPSENQAACFTLSGFYGTCPTEWKSLNGDLVVASVQSLDRNGVTATHFRSARPDGLYAVVVDEAHHVAAPTWRDLLGRLGQLRRLGLSATPERTNADENKYFPRFFPQGTWGNDLWGRLTEEGFLARIKPWKVDLKDVWQIPQQDETYMDRFHEVAPALLRQLSQSPSRQAKIVEEYLDLRRRYGRRSALLFAIDKEHAGDLCRRFSRADVQSECILSGEMDCEQRRDVVARFREGSIEVLCNVRIAAEGVDFPTVNTILMTRPTMSYVFYKQMVGRGVRGPRFGGSDSCLVMDFVDNIGRFSDRLMGADRMV